MEMGAWFFSPDYRQLCQVIETQTLWGEMTCRVWLPDRKAQTFPDLAPLLLLRVKGGGHD